MPTGMPGRPRVLAFVRSWSADRTSALELATMRAELRGLGAELSIYSATGLWSFGPDDAVEHERDCTPSELAAIAAAHGVAEIQAALARATASRLRDLPGPIHASPPALEQVAR